MKAWSIIGLLFAAAILATVPLSSQVTPRGSLELTIDKAEAYTYGRARRITRRTYRRGYRYARRSYRRAAYYGAASYYGSGPSVGYGGYGYGRPSYGYGGYGYGGPSYGYGGYGYGGPGIGFSFGIGRGY
jgi:hypothetical protein